jgi:hypothetical protein
MWKNPTAPVFFPRSFNRGLVQDRNTLNFIGILVRETDNNLHDIPVVLHQHQHHLENASEMQVLRPQEGPESEIWDKTSRGSWT